MPDKLKYILVLLFCITVQGAVAQFNPTYPPNQQQQNNNGNYYRDTARTDNRPRLTNDQLLDTLRKREEGKKDSVIFTSKFIKVTNEALLKDSTQLFPIDTTLANFENYSVLFQPRSPKISLGSSLGLAARSLLFEPSKIIGFDVGLHGLDPFLLTPQDIQYYNARVPYTLLSLYTGGPAEQYFKLLHTQNVKPNWNVGINLNFTGSRNYYSSNNVLGQNVSDLNAAVFTWYESKSKRYNLLANLVFNNLKSPETGGLLSDTIFTGSKGSFDRTTERV